MTGRDSGTFRSTAVAVITYAIAMGYLEAAVVVYLRAALGLTPAGFVPVPDPAAFGAFDGVEIARELATLVMIAAVGWVAGRSGLERLAWAAVIFGTWDIVYYLGLRLLIGWPSTPAARDVLFLAPVPWVAPVWAPLVVSIALVAFGMAAAHRLRAGHTIAVGPGRAFIALAAGGLVVVSFLVNTNSAPADDSATWAAWPFFWAGMALATATSIRALVGQSNAPLQTRGDPHHGSDSRPSVGSPD